MEASAALCVWNGHSSGPHTFPRVNRQPHVPGSLRRKRWWSAYSTMGTQASWQKLVTARFTPTCLTGGTMRFTHDSSRGSSSTPLCYVWPDQEKMVPCVRAEWDISYWAHFPFPACLWGSTCTTVRTRLFLPPFPLFVKTILQVFEAVLMDALLF